MRTHRSTLSGSTLASFLLSFNPSDEEPLISPKLTTERVSFNDTFFYADWNSNCSTVNISFHSTLLFTFFVSFKETNL